jgi:hypothetical protein
MNFGTKTKDSVKMHPAISSFTKCGNAVQNEFCGGSPNKWLWLLVVGRDVIVDGGDEFVHVLEYAAPDALLVNLRKPPLYLLGIREKPPG